MGDKFHSLIGCAWAAALAIGCGAQVAEKVQQGRFALRGLQLPRAVSLFREAAAMDPEYVFRNVLPISVFAYLSRAHFENHQFAEAQRAAETALGKNQRDHLARLYRGLASLRQGNREAGRRDLDRALRGIHQWNEEIATGNLFISTFWDSGRVMRGEIERVLRVSSSSDEAELTRIAEWVGKRLDEEIEQAQLHEYREHHM